MASAYNGIIVWKGTDHDAEHARRTRSERIPGPAILGGEDLRRDRVQHPIHNLPPHPMVQSAQPPTQRNPKLTLLKNAYPQFQPSSASELRAVVLANRNTPVSP